MPPKTKVSREEIINGAVELVRREGHAALNARAVARQLQISTQPIFSNFASMEALKGEVVAYAECLYRSFVQEDLQKMEYPPYKISGMAYVRFARQERELFKLLYMRDRRAENIPRGFPQNDPILAMVQQGTGLDRAEAERLHLETWVSVHGIATMIATDYLELDDETVSNMLTDIYQALRARFCEKERANEEHP